MSTNADSFAQKCQRMEYFSAKFSQEIHALLVSYLHVINGSARIANGRKNTAFIEI
jgi:hypothetical protein